MDEQKLQFRVGLFVLLAVCIAGVLVVRFGDLKQYWEESYALAIRFDEAPGVHPGTPVKMNGILIGRIRKVLLDDAEPGVLVVVDIQADRKLRTDSKASIARSIFGDSTIEFSPGSSPDYIPANMKLEGDSPHDPMEAVRRMEGQLAETLAAFRSTSAEWEAVGHNLNSLMETERGNLEQVIERTAVALDDFSKTMKAAHEMIANTNQLVASPEMQRSMQETIALLPQMARDTRDTIAAAKISIQKASESLDKVNANLDNVSQATAPLAENSRNMVARLNNGLIQLESLLTELNAFATVVNKEDGTLQKFVSDPMLYENLNRSASSLSLLLENLEPTLRDVRIFADKVARHPEVLGVSGALSPSSGIKETTSPRQSANPGQMQR
jgi:phospholipid/cholesterol/gamma-HCH transport system substrate-binding protein